MANIAYLQLTRKCNQKCRFCSNPPNDEILDQMNARKIIDEYKNNNYKGIVFTGGEPTLFNGLDELIKYSIQLGIEPRIITNGQLISDMKYLERLVYCGLKHIHVSFHSYKPAVQNYLSCNNDSFQNILVALKNCQHYPISVNINTVINKYNSDHLDKNVKWLVKEFPFINHFVWNNLDHQMNRVESNPDVIPEFHDFEISLYNAALFLKNQKRSFRIERVPLCYMADFAENSTETRKIVKNESRAVYFLDGRMSTYQDSFFYEKLSACSNCTLTSICPGVYGGKENSSAHQIFPLFIDKNFIIKKITG
jgi:MoaA/NifB/PqqE/SkfB family radical SAM enzyme